MRPGLQSDPYLRYAWSDVNHARAPEVVAAAYTYNPNDGKLTTNYAIDRALGCWSCRDRARVKPRGLAQHRATAHRGLLWAWGR